ERSDAFELYLKGRYYWNKRTEQSLDKSVTQFQQALSEDPGYALAHAGLAETYVTLAIYGVRRPAEVMPRAKASAESALDRKTALAEALTALACVQSTFDWDWTSAMRNFRRAILLSPNYPIARQWFAMHCLIPLRRFDEARAEIARARELEPLSLAIIASAGVQ